MRSENAELRQKVGILEGSDTRQEEEPLFESDRKVSRRRLLSKAGAAAASLVVAGALTQRDIREAKASGVVYGVSDEPGVPGVLGQGTVAEAIGVWGDSLGVGVRGQSNKNAGVFGKSKEAPGVYGESETWYGVNGFGMIGVRGEANQAQRGAVEGDNPNTLGYGVRGCSQYLGVYGTSTKNEPGVSGQSKGAPGVLGVSTNYYGVAGIGTIGVQGEGTTASSRGVQGLSSNNDGPGVAGTGRDGVYGESSIAGQNGVWGKQTNQGSGVFGEGRVGVLGISSENGWNGVWGSHTANGRAVAGDSALGVGVDGVSTSGYGGQF